MKNPEIIIFTIVGCIILFLLSKHGAKQDGEVNLPKSYPYKKKMLLTNTEYAFFKVLKEKCAPDQYMICPKVRMEDFLSVTATDKKGRMRHRGYIRSRHIDFLLCDTNLYILAGIELDDKSHSEKDAKKVDQFKDGVFEAIGVPLFRIKAVRATYVGQIDAMLGALNGEGEARK